MVKYMSKRKIALIINIIIIIAEIIGLSNHIIVDHTLAIQYYTIDSNLLVLVSSILFIIFYKKNINLVKDIRFLATGLLTVTFLVVIFILCPMQNFNYKLLMFTDYYFVFHTLVPILSIISYICYEDKSNKNYLCLIYTIIYGIVLVSLNILNIIEGPYPFLMIKNQKVIVTIIWSILLIGGSHIISLTLNRLNTKIKGTK